MHSGVGALIRCKNILPRKILKTIYFSIIHPHILYGIVLWGSADKSALRPLLSCHSRAVKLCQQKNTSGLLLLPKLFEAQLGSFMYKAFHQGLPINIQKRFTINNNIYNTRSQYVNFKVIIKSNKILNNKPSVKGPYFWNTLPSHIREAKTFGSFKRSLNKILLGSYSWV